METAIYQINLKDGRKFKVFCANRTQINKVLTKCHELKDKIQTFERTVNGIHNINDFIAHSKTF